MVDTENVECKMETKCMERKGGGWGERIELLQVLHYVIFKWWNYFFWHFKNLSKALQHIDDNLPNYQALLHSSIRNYCGSSQEWL